MANNISSVQKREGGGGRGGEEELGIFTAEAPRHRDRRERGRMSRLWALDKMPSKESVGLAFDKILDSILSRAHKRDRCSI